MKHRYLSGLLLILLLAQISCGSAADTPAVTTGTDTTQTASETTVVNAPELPERDYGGESFDILTAGNWDNNWTEIYDFMAEEETGEPVNDAVYRRNRAVEEPVQRRYQ